MRTLFYIVSWIASYNLILSLSWMRQNRVILNVDRTFFMIDLTEIFVQNWEIIIKKNYIHFMMSVTFYTNLTWKKKRQKKIEMFLTSMTDIEKILIFKKKSDSRMLLLSHYYKFLDIFNHTMTEKLSSFWEEKTDYCIELEKVDEKKS